jgi:hypothetical protein
VAVPCYFKATADSLPLIAPDEAWRGSAVPVYTIPPGTKEVRVTATPQADTYWEITVSFSVSNDGFVTPTPESSFFVKLTSAIGLGGVKVFYANIRVSRFKEVTTELFGLFKDAPVTRKEPPFVQDHQERYGTWPPLNWDLHDVPDAHFLADVKIPVEGGVLKLAKGLAIENKVENVVLKLAGVEAPQFFAVTWPKAVVREKDAPPTRFLLYLRQTNSNYVGSGFFEGPSQVADFDYADIGLFETLHYAAAPPWRMPGAKPDPLFWPYSKGVPYQVAKAGVDVVTVCPCPRYYGPDFGKEYGELNKTENTGKILEELQAFMFTKVGIQAPKSVGDTAIAAFSSGNYILRKWLSDSENTAGKFLSSTVHALYFLDPPPDKKGLDLINDCIKFSLAWAGGAERNKRIRLYQRVPWPSHMTLLEPGSSSSPPPEPPEPFVRNSIDTRRTLSVIADASWKRTVAKALRGRAPSYPWDWRENHHLIAATMLTHALAQDFTQP